jgi:chromosome segregation protein
LINTGFGKLKELSRGDEAIVTKHGAYLTQHVYDDEFVQLINSLSTAVREYFKISRGCFSSIKPSSDSMLDNILNCKSQVNELLLALNGTKYSQRATTPTKDKINLINEKFESLNEFRSNILKNLKVLHQASNKFYDNAKVLFKKMKITRSSKLEEFNTMVKDIPTDTQRISRRVASTIIEKASPGFHLNKPPIVSSRIMSKSPPKRHRLTESIDNTNSGMRSDSQVNDLYKQIDEKNKLIQANENKLKRTQKNFEEAQSIISKYEMTINNIEDEVRQLKDTYTNEKKTLEQKAQTMEKRAKEFEQLNKNLTIDNNSLQELKVNFEKEKKELEGIIKERLNSGVETRIGELKEIINENENKIA